MHQLTNESINQRINQSIRDTFFLSTSTEELKSAAQKLTSALDERDLDLESAIVHLEEERHRNASLIHVNAMLREQLDQATAANQVRAGII